MKKTLILILTVVFVGVLAFVVYIANAAPTMTGRYLVTTNEISMIVNNNGAPIIMSNQSEDDDIFSNLQNGDKIKVTYDGIDLSYPGQTGVYSCKLIAKGSLDDIPKTILFELQDMGWELGESN